MTAENVEVGGLPRTIQWVEAEFDDGGRPTTRPCIRIVDQRLLPGRLEYLDLFEANQLIVAIQTLAVRGAPALGVAGAMGVALWLYNEAPEVPVNWLGFSQTGTIHPSDQGEGERESVEAAGEGAAASEGEPAESEAEPAFAAQLQEAAAAIANARPTAVNLAWGVGQVMDVLNRTMANCDDLGLPCDRIGLAVVAEKAALLLAQDDEDRCRAIGSNGAQLLPPDAVVITHCNAGSLATSYFGTALGVVYAAHAQGRIKHVYADETRPLGQGARLTMWELTRAGVPCTLECDGMAASLMATRHVDAVIVGADRIAANGDTANKIGTLQLAIAAKHFGVPVYVAAPLSTFDFSLADGGGIPIEQRAADEVCDQAEFPRDVYNPAFDVTPAALIAAFITERGVFRPGELGRLQAEA